MGEPVAGVAELFKTPFEDVAEEVFCRYGRNWKPGMLAVNRAYPKKPNPSPIQGTTDRRHHEQGCRSMVRLAPYDSSRSRPSGTGPVRDHAGGRNQWLPPERQQPLPEYLAIPAAWPRTVPVRRGKPPAATVQIRHDGHVLTAAERIGKAVSLALAGAN